MKQMWMVFSLLLPATVWQTPLAEIDIPWWVWLLLVAIVLTVLFIVLVLAPEPGPPLGKPKHEDEERHEKH
jgi:hypothetical protein